MAEDDTMVDHLKSFFDATDKLKLTDTNLDDDLLAIMLLQSLPASYENFRCAIESRDSLPGPRNPQNKSARRIQISS
uniref:Retrovirus-related Pol polyprotein from transposon TNT 1-94 n=1 Tax=Trichogramma kaykai TaxID=54128 RepID=A0ABD2WYV7_9HYME